MSNNGHILGETGFRRKEIAFWIGTGTLPCVVWAQDLNTQGFEEEDWIGLYDDEGYCRGYNPVSINEGKATIILAAQGQSSGKVLTIDGELQVSPEPGRKFGFYNGENMNIFLHRASDDKFYRVEGTFYDWQEWSMVRLVQDPDLPPDYSALTLEEEVYYGGLKFWHVESLTVKEEIHLNIDEDLTRAEIYATVEGDIRLGQKHRAKIKMKKKNISNLTYELIEGSIGRLYKPGALANHNFMFEAEPGGDGLQKGRFTGKSIYTGKTVTFDFEVMVSIPELPESTHIFFEDNRFVVYQNGEYMMLRSKLGYLYVSSSTHGSNMIIGDYRVPHKLERLTRDANAQLINGLPNKNLGKVVGTYMYPRPSGTGNNLYVDPNDPKIRKQVPFEFDLLPPEVPVVDEEIIFENDKLILTAIGDDLYGESKIAFVIAKFLSAGRYKNLRLSSKNKIYDLEECKEKGLELVETRHQGKTGWPKTPIHSVLFIPDDPSSIEPTLVDTQYDFTPFIDLPYVKVGIKDGNAVVANMTDEKINFELVWDRGSSIAASVQPGKLYYFSEKYITNYLTRGIGFKWQISGSLVKGKVEINTELI